MLGHRPFSFNLIKKYTALFGTLFNDLVLERRDADGTLRDSLRVPLSYAAKDKMMARLESSPDADQRQAVILPRMSFEMQSPVYAANRMIGKTNQSSVIAESGAHSSQFQPVPYDFPFKLWVYGKSSQDVHGIVEQVLPAFTPNFSVTAELVPEMNETRDVQVVLNGIAKSDNATDGDYKERRLVVWEMSFKVQGYLWGPITDHPVIKFANASFYDATRYDPITDAVGEVAAIDRVTAQPGLLANGSPTTNADASIPYAEIDEDDDWDYAVKVYGTLVLGDGDGGADEPVEEH